MPHQIPVKLGAHSETTRIRIMSEIVLLWLSAIEMISRKKARSHGRHSALCTVAKHASLILSIRASMSFLCMQRKSSIICKTNSFLLIV